MPAAERGDYVRRACADDPELRKEVEGLLEAGARADSFLEDSADTPLAEALVGVLAEAEPGERRIGARVGPYRLVSRIGRGGMADVYLAEREDGGFQQRVAVKVQRRGTDTEDVLSRFRMEREILAGLSHPNVARLYDGGATDDGLPYLVMEFVEGQPITDYCDEHELALRDRLEMFLDVTRGVQAAHGQLVVHRDIKPSNVLVTADGQVKLLDFGIAKLLDPAAWQGEAPRTRTDRRPLTPKYASPEQVLGEPITVASDIYQLGLLLYRLLTGGVPFEGMGRGRAREDAITETRPSKPSEYVATQTRPESERRRLSRALRGDLDTIVLTALRKEPERRYASAHEMGEDVRRYLEGRPVSARRDSRLYRMRKFLQRNRWVAPATGMALLGIAVYIGTLIRHGQQLEAERNAARIEAERARASQDFLVGLFRSTDPFAPAPESRRDIRVSEVMERGVRRATTELASQPEVQISLLSTIGDVFLGLGDAERSLEVHEAALELSRRHFGSASPEAARVQRGLVEPAARNERRGSGFATEATAIALDALTAVRRAFGPEHLEAFRAEVELGSVLSANGHYETAAVLLKHALEGIRASKDAEAEDEIGAVRRLASTLYSLEEMRGRLGNESRVYYGELLKLAEAAYGADHVRTAEARLLAAARLEEPAATRQRQLAIPVLHRELGPEHDQLARAYLLHALNFQRRGLTDSAIANHRAAADVWLRSGSSAMWASVALSGVGETLVEAGRPDEAIAAYDEALALVRSDSTMTERRIAFLERDRAWAAYLAGLPREPILATARRFLRLTEGQDMLGFAECLAALALADLGKTPEAQRLAAVGLQKSQAGTRPSPENWPCPSAVRRGIAPVDSM